MHNSRIRNIIWDWNGTLLDDMDICIDCMNEMLKNRSLPRLAHDHYREIFTFPVKDYLTGIGFDFSKEDFEIPAGEFIDLYNFKFREANLFNGVHQCLNQFREQGYKQYILSAQEQTLLNRLVDHYGLSGIFESVTGTSDNYAHSKIETGKRMMKDLKLNNPECMIIGDTLHDYEVAVALDIKCILVSHGHQSPSRLRSAGVPVTGSLLEIPKYLNNDHLEQGI